MIVQNIPYSCSLTMDHLMKAPLHHPMVKKIVKAQEERK